MCAFFKRFSFCRYPAFNQSGALHYDDASVRQVILSETKCSRRTRRIEKFHSPPMSFPRKRESILFATMCITNPNHQCHPERSRTDLFKHKNSIPNVIARPEAETIENNFIKHFLDFLKNTRIMPYPELHFLMLLTLVCRVIKCIYLYSRFAPIDFAYIF